MDKAKLIDNQIKILEENGIEVLNVFPRITEILVSRADLEKASALKISNEITIACRC